MLKTVLLFNIFVTFFSRLFDEYNVMSLLDKNIIFLQKKKSCWLQTSVVICIFQWIITYFSVFLRQDIEKANKGFYLSF